MNKELKNGTELLLSLALSLELLDKYKASKLLKKKLNIAYIELERSILKHYNAIYSENEDFCTNSLTFKEDVIKIIADYNEADCILAIDFLKKFNSNIEIARKKGIIFFDKLL